MADRAKLSCVFEKTPLLAGLTPVELDLLANRSARKHYAAGELLFGEGEPCAGLFIIASGRVKIFKTSVNGREQVLAINAQGESLAELPVFDGGPYPASALAIEPTEIAFLSRRDFQAFCMEHPEVSLKVLAVVGSRLRHLVGIIEELSFTTIRQRLVALLVKLAHKEGKPNARGLEVTLPATHQELASQLGTVRELISRNLNRLQAEGLIEVEARRVLILDRKGLEAVLESA